MRIRKLRQADFRFPVNRADNFDAQNLYLSEGFRVVDTMHEFKFKKSIVDSVVAPVLSAPVPGTPVLGAPVPSAPVPSTPVVASSSHVLSVVHS